MGALELPRAPLGIDVWFAGVLAYTHRRAADDEDEDTHLLVRGRPGLAHQATRSSSSPSTTRSAAVEDTGVELKTVTAVRRETAAPRGRCRDAPAATHAARPR